jgi:hypothetical protein
MSYGHIVLASTKSGFIPAGIKWMTNSQFSHSFVTTPNILGVPMCIEAAEGGVDFTRFDTGYENNQNEGYQVWNIKIDQNLKDTAIISVLADLETGYGFLQFPYFIVRKICRLLGRDIKAKDNWFASDGMICSQLCVAYLKICGLSDVLAGYGNGSISPQDLQDIFVAHPELFELINSTRL